MSKQANGRAQPLRAGRNGGAVGYYGGPAGRFDFNYIAGMDSVLAIGHVNHVVIDNLDGVPMTKGVFDFIANYYLLAIHMVSGARPPNARA